ncbi:hypothetical protein CBS101457_005575 [Exobasidium rhododendri]|nr:hypothetical protein CBS101457_005575 [Exobasidium rhododendri]
MAARHHLLLFAKYPYHGKVKTRLEPLFGKANAQKFAETALLEVLKYFGRLQGDTVEDVAVKCVWMYAPLAAGEDVQRLLEGNNLSTIWEAWPQDDGAPDLGARLSTAVQRAARDHTGGHSTKRTCTLIGSDCFELTLDHIISSIQTASRGRPMLLPAVDGGYVSLSLPQPASISSFDNIRWSTAETASDQKSQLEQGGYTVELGVTLSDVDEPSDVRMLSTMSENTARATHLRANYPRTLAFTQA